MTEYKSIDDILKVFEDLIKELESCDKDDFILYWDNGLGVGFTEDHKPYACNVARAETIATHKMPEDAWAFIPNVLNGAQERAKVIARKKAIALEIERAKSTIQYVKDTMFKEI